LSTQPWRDPDIVFLSSGDALIFIGYEGTSTVGKYVTHIYLSTIHERQLLEYRSIYQPETRPHSMSISPDSLNLAFIEDNEGGPSLSILNLQTLDTLSLKPWERLQSNPMIIWSPDSQSIALSFMEQNRTKLVVVELLTQDVNLIMESTGVIEVMSWRNLEIEF
jgi:Tol biopolymer transport system component